MDQTLGEQPNHFTSVADIEETACLGVNWSEDGST